jgi:DNA-directed RNA polymerase II subunit RPB1
MEKKRFSSSKFSDAPLKNIQAIQFGILDPKFIEAYSVCEVVNCDSTSSDSIIPKDGGLNDIRMGPVAFGGKTVIQCSTDNLDYDNCPGYFGHVKLARPVYHISFLKTVKRVLSCVSYGDSSLLFSDFNKSSNITKYKGEKKLRRLFEESRGIKQCPKTGYPQPCYEIEISATDGIRVKMKFPTKPGSKNISNHCVTSMETNRELLPTEALLILGRISDDDIYMLGFDGVNVRPEWMIITILPIPPPSVRPTIIYDAVCHSEDDLTKVLSDIIFENNNIKRLDECGAGGHVVEAAVSRMQTRISCYFDNSLPKIERLKHMGRTIKSISERLKGKHGRIRGNLMGKRVDFTARTVITGDASISLEELGVPNSISRNLTYPEVVSQFNIIWLQYIIRRKNFKRIIRDIGCEIRSYFKVLTEFQLELGDTVERHLIDGDIVLFNRQPSLHKMSMMGHRIRILPYSTFRLNLSVTTPYNADFDGDEMNMHVPQTLEARAEVKGLMMVPLNIVSPQKNKPVISIVQDTLLGCNLITRRDVFISKDVFINICMCHEDWNRIMPIPTVLKPQLLWTGKQVFNILLPILNLSYDSNKNLNLEIFDSLLGESHVNISNGELLSGVLSKKTLGPSAGGLIHVTWLEHGPDTTRSLISNIQMCVTYWLLQNGMSVGIGDTVADRSTVDKIKKVISMQKEEVAKIVCHYQTNEMEADPGLSLMETFEKAVNQVLNKARESAGKAAQQSLRDYNNMKRMIIAGSKGNNNNISQVIACVAQQNVEGQRIGFGFRGRSLPHFILGDYGPKSKGFIENSYLSGLEPQELFFHAMGGREGLIDTAIKTADSGYIQRKLVKALEDLLVRYDGTVRNCEGEIIQFVYGEDGIDGTNVEPQMLDYINMSVNELEYIYRFDFTQPTSSSLNWLNKTSTKKLNCEIFQEKLDSEYGILLDSLRELRKGLIQPEKAEDPIALPVHLKRLIVDCQKKFRMQPPKIVLSELDPITIMTKVEQLLSNLSQNSKRYPLCSNIEQCCPKLFENLVRSTLASKRVLREYKLSKIAFDWLLKEIEDRFHLAQVDPGEMIGTVAAQSLGEPTTQMTLNTFHSAGIGTKNVTLGVPRIKEILNVSSNIKTPSLTIYLKSDVSESQKRSKKVASSIEYTTLGKLLLNLQIWYDPDLMNTVIKNDQFLLDLYSLELREDHLEMFSPWILRMELDKTMILDKEIITKDVSDMLEKNLSGSARILYSPLNSDIQVIRIRFLIGENDSMQTFQYENSSKTIPKFFLKGVKQIHRAMISKTKKTRLCDKTAKEGCKLPYGCNIWSSFETFPESWVIYTEGTNLQDVMSFSEEINHREIYSNDLIETCQTLGIEASRVALFLELKRVIEFDGSSVNYRHLAILVEIMTYRGEIIPINRHGINRYGSNPLAKCSFEEPVEILMKAAMFAVRDPITGVSDNLIIGQLAMVGTASFEIVIDETVLTHAKEFNPVLITKNSIKLPDIIKSGTCESSYLFQKTISIIFGTIDNEFDFSSLISSEISPINHIKFDLILDHENKKFRQTLPTISLSSLIYRSISPAYSPSSPFYSPLLNSPTLPVYQNDSSEFQSNNTEPSKDPFCNFSSPMYNPVSFTY